MTTFQWSVRGGFFLLSLALFFSFLPDQKSVARLGETPLGISEQKVERHHLAEPALGQAEELVSLLEKPAIRRQREAAELALPSGLPEAKPQTDPSLADGVTIQEESLFLIKLYAAKYGIPPKLLEEVIRGESNFNPEATGKEGERGLAQFLFGTWLTTPQARYGWDAAWHPAVNIEAAAWMLSQGRAGEFHAIR